MEAREDSGRGPAAIEESPAPTADSKPSTTQVNVRLDATLVRRAKVKLAVEARTMQSLLSDFLEDWVEKSS